MVKKAMLFLLCLFLITLAACSKTSQTTSDGRINLDYWVLFGGGDLGYMQDIVSEFNESQDEIYVNIILQDFDDYYTKLVTSVAANRGPDVAVSHAATVPELVNQGLTTPLNDLAGHVDMDFNDFYDNLKDAMEVEGEYHAVPIDSHPFILYVNTDLAEEADLLDENGQPIIEETPEGFKDFFMKARQALPDKTGIAITTGGLDVYRWWWTTYFQMGGTPIFSDDLTDPEITLDQDIAVEAAEYVHSFFGDIIPMHLSDPYETFQSGNAFSLMTGVWGTGIWENADLPFTAVPYPQLFDVEAAQGGSHTLIMPIKEESTDARQQAKMEFIKYVSDSGLKWAEAGHIPSKPEIVESEPFQELPYRSDYSSISPYIVFTDSTIYQSAAETDMTRSLDEIMAGRLTAEEGIKKMVHDLEVTIR
ncbi:extracellular solute-binding protein [Alkalicoccobacillus murimartini]|uniref:Multiple sugar transport system substrate-binding protein n=1 Tax=Alkalicoccobacillus murimartini TaxID=171685 RepID=A0ABT9YJC3_9BACI|nr:extracellular solute-binding protein [Alkalicoccobacillus murimartini]MDQ0207821.1 multiple sugar transport system substrate-binding protein [Alkalicoccobacillus murimartini]